MRNLLRILTKADNVAILVMLLSVAFFTFIGFRQALRHDREARRRREKETAPPRREEGRRSNRIFVWPYLVRKEFLAAILVTIGLLLWSVVLDAPLEELANPTLTPNPAKAPWYFLGLQEMLVYFDPWIAGVTIPFLIIAGLMSVPYLDPNPSGNGYYTLAERRYAIPIFCFGFLVLWIGLIGIGVFFRGPGWLWFWPWQEWDTSRMVSETNVDLTEFLSIPSRSAPGFLLGGAVVVLYYLSGIGLPYLWLRRRRSPALEALGGGRYLWLAFLVCTMLALPIKILLRLAFHLKYVWTTPWFNI